MATTAYPGVSASGRLAHAWRLQQCAMRARGCMQLLCVRVRAGACERRRASSRRLAIVQAQRTTAPSRVKPHYRDVVTERRLSDPCTLLFIFIAGRRGSM
jgi:hypothetical protein